MSRASDAFALARAERQRTAARLRAEGSARLIARVVEPVTPCTAAERAVYDATLVGITHTASHWRRCEEGHLWLVMAPRGAGVGQAITGGTTRTGSCS